LLRSPSSPGAPDAKAAQWEESDVNVHTLGPRAERTVSKEAQWELARLGPRAERTNSSCSSSLALSNLPKKAFPLQEVVALQVAVAVVEVTYGRT